MKELYHKCKNLYVQYKEIINYLIFGGLTFVVSMLTYYICRLAFDYVLSNLISWVAAVLFAYITNKAFVFESKTETIFLLIKEFVLFIASRIFTLLLETAILYIMVDWLHINDMLVKVIAQIIVILTNYILSKLVIFKNKNKTTNTIK